MQSRPRNLLATSKSMRPQFKTLSDEIHRELKQGVDLEIKRFEVAEQFPVNPQMSQIHYKANWFGMRTSEEDRVCPCCLERIKENQFSFWKTRMSNNFLSTDIILFFNFIRFLTIFLFLKLLIVDAYSMWLNYRGVDCGGPSQKICVPKLFSRLSSTNRMSQEDTYMVTDLLNLAFLIVSIIFWTFYERYSYKKLFIDVAAQIQTEDDFTVFAEDIPVVQDINEGVIDYRKALKDYFNNIVKEWLQNPTDDELYKSYLKACQAHGHLPTNPPRIVTKINLCWNLYELTAIHDLKDEIQELHEERIQKETRQDRMNESYKRVNQETHEELTALNTTEVELCQQFQINEKFGFALSRFLGKSFISFQYQHFALHVIRTILTAKRFLKDVNLKVTRAAFPRDVYWENLNVSDTERNSRIRTTITITLGCLTLAFLAFLSIKYFQIKHMVDLKDSEHLNWWIRISTSILTVFVTMLLYWIIDQLSLFQEHGTRTRYQISYLYKAIAAVICNNVFNICIAHYILKIEIWSPEGLSLQVINTLIIWYISQTLYHSMYLNWTLRWIRLKWNYRSTPILKFQNRFNAEYVLPTYPITSRYCSYLSDIYFLCFFGYLVPSSSLLGLVTFVTYYFIDKVNILKRSSYHPNYSYFLAEKAIRMVQSSTLMFTLGNYLFAYILTGRRYNPVNLLAIIISVIYMMVIWGNKKRVKCFDDYVVYQQKSFTDCMSEDKFFDTYGSLNPATKLSSKDTRKRTYLGVTAPTYASPAKSTAPHEQAQRPSESGEKESGKHTKA